MADLCFITTCRGRLAHLKEALPTFVSQPGTMTVVTDYECPDGTADWVEANYPQVRVVRATNRPVFEISRARNIGAEGVEADWLCFVDADDRLAPGFAEGVRAVLKRGFFYRPNPQSVDGAGICICHAEDFRAIGGYDAVLQGYGMEDRDLYMRLNLIGIKQAAFPGELIEVVHHEVALRTKNYDVKNVRLNSALNQLYCNVKWDLGLLKGRDLSEAKREQIYAQVSKAVLKAHAQGTDLTFRIGVNEQPTNLKTELQTTLVYQLRMTRPDPAKAGTAPADGNAITNETENTVSFATEATPLP